MNSGYGSMLDSVLHIVWCNNQNNKPTYKLTNYTKTDWEKTLVNNQGHLTISHPLHLLNGLNDMKIQVFRFSSFLQSSLEGLKYN